MNIVSHLRPPELDLEELRQFAGFCVLDFGVVKNGVKTLGDENVR